MTEPAPPPAPTSYERYLPWRRWVEVGYWVLAMGLSAAGNTITVTMELERAGLAFHPMEPAIWEWSSNLVLLAPDLQEEILFLPRTLRGRDAVKLSDLQPIALTFDWKRQRRLWQQLRDSRSR